MKARTLAITPRRVNRSGAAAATFLTLRGAGWDSLALRATNLLRSLIFLLSVSGLAATGGCAFGLDFEQCPGDPCDKGLVCIDGGCVQPPNPGCTAPDPPVVGDGLVLASLQTLTGEYSETSLNHQAAMKLAQQQLNSSGALGERTLSIVWCDTQNDETRFTDALRYVVDRLAVSAVVGIEASSLVVEHGAYTSERGVLMMSHWATASSVTDFAQRVDGTTLVWRTSSSDVYQSAALADIVEASCVPPERVATLFLDDDYGVGLADGLRDGLCGSSPGATPAGCMHSRQRLPETQSQLTGVDKSGDPQLETDAEVQARVASEADVLVDSLLAARDDIDILAVLGFAEHATPIARAFVRRETDWPELTWVVGESVLDPTFLSEEATVSLGMRVLGADPGRSKGLGFRTFDRAFRRASNELLGEDAAPAAFSTHAYDSVLVLGLAAAAVPAGEPVTGDALAAGIARLADPAGPRFRPDELLRAGSHLRSAPTATINLDGASGDLDFDPAVGEAPGTSIEVALGQADGSVCSGTNLGFACREAATPACREPCTEPFPDVLVDANSERLLLGGLLSMSGETRGIGTSRRQAMELALEQLNAPGVGRPVQMILCDVETDARLAASQAEMLIEEHGVAAIVGPSTSQQAFSVAPSAEKAGVMMITPSATAPSVTRSFPPSADGVRLIWRTAPSDFEQAGRLATFVTEESCIDRLGMVYRQDVYGQGLRSAFTTAACPESDCPFELVAHEMAPQISEAEVADLIRSVQEASPPLDALLLFVFRGDGLDLLLRLKDAGVEIPLIASETLLSQEVATTPGLEGLVLHGTNPGLARGPGWADFLVPFRAKYDADPDSFAAASYDAVILAGLAAATVDAAVPPTGSALARGLMRLIAGDQEFTTADLRGATTLLRSSADAQVDYQGASGALSLDVATGEAPSSVPLYRIVDGVLGRFEVNAGDRLFCP